MTLYFWTLPCYFVLSDAFVSKFRQLFVLTVWNFLIAFQNLGPLFDISDEYISIDCFYSLLSLLSHHGLTYARHIHTINWGTEVRKWTGALHWLARGDLWWAPCQSRNSDWYEEGTCVSRERQWVQRSRLLFVINWRYTSQTTCAVHYIVFASECDYFESYRDTTKWPSQVLLTDGHHHTGI